MSACDKQEVTYRDIEVKLGSTLATTNSDGDLAYNYLDALSTDVDFRGEKNVSGKVTIHVGSHPDAAGHAYKAKKIYEETLSLFQ